MDKQELLKLHGVNNNRNEYGVKSQSNSYRIRKGIFYRGFDVPTKEEANKEIKRLKSEGLKCFKEFQDRAYYRIFFEEKLQEVNNQFCLDCGHSKELHQKGGFNEGFCIRCHSEKKKIKCKRFKPMGDL